MPAAEGLFASDIQQYHFTLKTSLFWDITVFLSLVAYSSRFAGGPVGLEVKEERQLWLQLPPAHDPSY